VADDGHDSGTKRLVVALVRGVHGLRGTVRVEVLTDRPEDRFVPGAVLYPEGGDTPLTVATAEPVQDGPGWRLRFAEVASRDQADSLRGSYLETEVRPGVELARGEVYWHEVIGVPVRDLDGADLGVVKDVYRVAGTEVYVVGGGRFGTFDLPAVRAFIRIFAPRRGEIVIDAAALDLSPPKARPTGPDRPRAPRRSSRKPKSGDPSSTAASPTVASSTSAEDPQGGDAAAGTDLATDVGA
jgi:16S rRNA processing protein RimM